MKIVGIFPKCFEVLFEFSHYYGSLEAVTSEGKKSMPLKKTGFEIPGLFNNGFSRSSCCRRTASRVDDHLNQPRLSASKSMSFLPSKCCMCMCELNQDLIRALPATSVPIEMQGVMFNHYKRDLRRPG